MTYCVWTVDCLCISGKKGEVRWGIPTCGHLLPNFREAWRLTLGPGGGHTFRYHCVPPVPPYLRYHLCTSGTSGPSVSPPYLRYLRVSPPDLQYDLRTSVAFYAGLGRRRLDSTHGWGTHGRGRPRQWRHVGQPRHNWRPTWGTECFCSPRFSRRHPCVQHQPPSVCDSSECLHVDCFPARMYPRGPSQSSPQSCWSGIGFESSPAIWASSCWPAGSHQSWWPDPSRRRPYPRAWGKHRCPEQPTYVVI